MIRVRDGMGWWSREVRLSLRMVWVLSLVASVVSAQSQAVRVLGLSEESQRVLFDRDRSVRSALRLDYGSEGQRSLTVALPGMSSVHACTLWFAAGRAPSAVEMQVSQDLFRWDPAGRGSPGSAAKGAVRVVVRPSGRVAQFVRFVFPEKGTGWVLTELSLSLGPPPRLGRLEIAGRALGEDRIEAVLTGDAEFYGMVRYGEDAGSLADGPLTAEYGREHRFVLEGLERGTEYQLVGIGRDASGELRYVGPVKVRTAGEPRPKVLAWLAGRAGVTTAVLELQANKPVRAEVVLASAEGRILAVRASEGMAAGMRLRLEGLSQETVYKAKVTVMDAAGDAAVAETVFGTAVSNAAKQATVEGDFRMVGESLAPVESPEAWRRLADDDWSYLQGSVMSLPNDEDDRGFVLDFGTPRDLLRLELFWWALAYPSSFRVDISADGRDWLEVHRGGSPRPLDQRKTPTPDLRGIPTLVSVVPLERPVRLVRCVFPKGCGVFRFTQYRNIRLLEVRAVPKVQPLPGVRAEWLR